MSLRLAWRNVWRRPMRTLLTVSSISLGTGLLLFVVYYAEGFKVDLYRRYTGVWIGHAQVHASGFSRESGQFNAISEEARSVLRLSEAQSSGHPRKSEIISFTTRLFADGIVSIGTRRSPVEITGVELEGEKKVVSWWRGIESGKLDLSKRFVLIGQKLAADNEIVAGDRVVVSASRFDGTGFSSMSFDVSGTLRTGVASLDRMGLLMSQNNFRMLTAFDGRAHEWVLKTNALSKDFHVDVSHLMQAPRVNLKVSTWDQIQPEARTVFEMQDTFIWIMVAALLSVVAFGVLNSVTMSFLERTPEIGVQKALGTHNSEVLLMILFEGVILSAIGLAGAIFLAALAYTVTSQTGIPLGMEAEFQGLVLRDPVFPAFVWPTSIGITLAAVFFVIAAALVVARRAARLSPIDALNRSRRRK